MKFSKYFMLAGAAAMLTACSSEEPFVGPNNNFDPDEVTYAQFNIAMKVDGTRASSATAGDASEYAVKNGKILIFGLKAGVTDNIENRVKAVYVSSAELEIPEDHQVATAGNYDDAYNKVLATFEKGTFQTEYETFYGVCVLNYDSSWLPTGKEGTITFQEWAENKDLNGAFKNTNGFVMSNAALYDGDVKVLSKITTGAGYVEDDAEDLDKTKTAATFTVQRVAAKVSVASESKSWNIAVADENTPAVAVFENWALDNTRTTSYPVQNVWADYSNEIQVKSLFTETSRYVERGLCMWAGNKYYTNALESYEADNTIYARYTANTLHNMTSTSDYVRENVMAPNQMSKATVTRVVFKAKYVLGEDATAAAETLIGINDKVYTAATLISTAEAAAGAAYKDKVSVTATESGEFNLKEVITITGASDAVYRQVAAALGVINYTAKEVNFYKDGECWYVAYVKHFGAETDALKTQIFPNQYTAEYTGRYGILRNNWYEINVKSVKGIGSPVVPTPDPGHTPDDDGKRTERNMNVDINILKWAKRIQNVDF